MVSIASLNLQRCADYAKMSRLCDRNQFWFIQQASGNRQNPCDAQDR
jgi:hypothetical protein